MTTPEKTRATREREKAQAREEAFNRRMRDMADASIAQPIRINKMAGIYKAPAWGRGVGTNCPLPGALI